MLKGRHGVKLSKNRNFYEETLNALVFVHKTHLYLELAWGKTESFCLNSPYIPYFFVNDYTNSYCIQLGNSLKQWNGYSGCPDCMVSRQKKTTHLPNLKFDDAKSLAQRGV